MYLVSIITGQYSVWPGVYTVTLYLFSPSADGASLALTLCQCAAGSCPYYCCQGNTVIVIDRFSLYGTMWIACVSLTIWSSVGGNRMLGQAHCIFLCILSPQISVSGWILGQKQRSTISPECASLKSRQSLKRSPC